MSHDKPPMATVLQPGPGQMGTGMQMSGFSNVAAPPGGLPMGLAYLMGLDEVRIHQHFDTLEVVVGWERNNKYRICNNQDQQFMYAKEETDCMTRQCCGPNRDFVIHITDNNMQELVRLDRPLRCHGYFGWCCFLQEMDIQSPQAWTPWVPKYDVIDATGVAQFQILGECCFCMPCQDIPFKIVDMHGQEVGQIIKHWGGCREIMGGVNDFSVHFPREMDVMKKALLLGATFLIDFEFFERKKN
ncbi:hypothetical protein ScPMuIL_003004 [Solemya velum]